MFLTVEDGLILGPICWLFGNIFELLYKLVAVINESLFNVGYANLSVCVILFTIFVRLCIYPLNFKQQKSSKVMAMIQPEINKATRKYNGKTDQESILKKNQITQEIQKKYGVSMTSGCLPTLIQLPVFFGLYRVIQNIPAYVSDMKDKYVFIVNSMKTATFDADKLSALGLDSSATYIDVINAIASDDTNKVSTAVSAASTMMKNVSDGAVSNERVIDVLDKISVGDWNEILDVFTFSSADVSSTVASYVENFQNMNQFVLGINISDTPGWKLSVAILVPILSAVFQFISTKISMASTNQQAMYNPDNPQAAQTQGMMNSMLYTMPLMSLFICISLPVAIGIYWVIGALISIFTQLATNAYYKKCDKEELLAKCMEKAAKKQAKYEEKHPGKKSFYERMLEAQNGNVSTDEHQSENINKMAGSRLKNYTSASASEVQRTNTNTKYKEGSLGAKANIMLQYENKDGGKK